MRTDLDAWTDAIAADLCGHTPEPLGPSCLDCWMTAEVIIEGAS